MNILLLLICLAAPLASAESPETYYLRVTQQNRRSLEAAYQRHAKVKARLGDRSVRGTRTVESTDSDRRFGGGVGYRGYGGQGGYAGYSDQFVGGGFGFNYGYGFGQPGNSSQTGGTTTATTYEKVWHDNAWYGGPVEVLNPFCPPEVP